jgi:ribosomal protein S18 acetylase RimI-like enzyme
MHINYRFATGADSPVLASMNQQLIRDEGHRNRMTVSELEKRMRGWLASDYRAVLFERNRTAAGYALFRNEPDYIYLRQFYVQPEFRRQRIGRAAMEWLVANAWTPAERIRIEVLAGNAAGIDFWRALGFRDYALTMERD